MPPFGATTPWSLPRARCRFVLDDGARLGEGPLVLQHIAASMARYRVMQGLNLITRGQAGFLGLSQRLAA